MTNKPKGEKIKGGKNIMKIMQIMKISGNNFNLEKSSPLHLNNFPLKVTLLLSLVMLSITLSGCGYYYKERMRAEQWILAETSNYKKPYSWQQNLEMPYHSDNPKDYILNDGWAVAIPGQRGFDLYISPYSPNKYFRSRQAPWSEVICPYSGNPLILGKRGVVAERAIPSDQIQ